MFSASFILAHIFQFGTHVVITQLKRALKYTGQSAFILRASWACLPVVLAASKLTNDNLPDSLLSARFSVSIKHYSRWQPTSATALEDIPLISKTFRLPAARVTGLHNLIRFSH